MARSIRRGVLVILFLLAAAAMIGPLGSEPATARAPGCTAGEYLAAVDPVDYDGGSVDYGNLSRDDRETFLRTLVLTESEQTFGLLLDSPADPLGGRWDGRYVTYRNTTYKVARVYVDCAPTRTARVVTREVTRTVVITRTVVPPSPSISSPGQPGFTVLAAVGALLVVIARSG